MKKLLLIGLLASPLAACSVNPSDAGRALHAMGIKQVKMGGYAFFGCGEKDTFKSTFGGVGADGQQPHHRGFCRGGDWGDGFNFGIHRHWFWFGHH